MSEYNVAERKIAQTLDRYPIIKQTAKTIYQRLNYRLFGDESFKYNTHGDVTIKKASEEFEVDNRNSGQFFGYFDITPWDKSMEKAIYHELKEGDGISITQYSPEKESEIASSDAWNYQQGSRTQWHPEKHNQILFNDTLDGELVARLVNVNGENKRTYRVPIQAVNPQGGDYLSLNYRRLDRNRPDYGYGTDDGTPLTGPDDDGLRLVDFEDGNSELVVPLSRLLERTDTNTKHEHHYVNHALYDPTGDRFVFMHRWQGPDGRRSRLYIANRSGELRLLMDEGIVSHYCWLDADQLLVWGRTERFGDGYHIIDVNTGEKTYVDVLDEWGDGHPSVSPNGRYVVTDTYPDRQRKRQLLLYDRENETVTRLGKFFEPLEYTGVDRCDLHPRWSPDGEAISIDSAHTGTRDSYVLDVSNIVD